MRWTGGTSSPARRVAGALVIVVGTGGVAAGLRGTPPVIRSGPTRFVNADFPGINAHNSPAAAADPARPRALAVADRIDTPAFSCSVARSVDGGATWRPVALPDPALARECYWPDVAFDDRGRLLVLFTPYAVTTGRFNHPVGVWIQPFTGETPDGPPVQVAGAGAHHARLAVDGRRVVVAWVQTGPATADTPLGFAPAPNPLLVSRSDDGGRTFSPPVVVGEPHRLVVQPTVVLGPGGHVVVGALDLGDDLLDYEGRHQGQGGPPPAGRWRVVTWTSRDAGATFSAASVVGDLVIPHRIVVDLAPTPGLARDPSSGRLYATWDGGRADRRDVFLARSDDGGSSWSAPTRVAPRPQGQFLPAVAVAPDGRVDVLFYDRSGDPADELAAVVLASSWDGGRSFTLATVSDRPFDSRIGFGSAQGLPVLSSQLAVVSAPDRAVAFWADTRRGNLDTGAQDLAVAVVAIRRGGGAHGPVVALGLALIAAGLVLTAGRRRPRTTT